MSSTKHRIHMDTRSNLPVTSQPQAPTCNFCWGLKKMVPPFCQWSIMNSHFTYFGQFSNVCGFWGVLYHLFLDKSWQILSCVFSHHPSLSILEVLPSSRDQRGAFDRWGWSLSLSPIVLHLFTFRWRISSSGRGLIFYDFLARGLFFGSRNGVLLRGNLV